MSSTWEQWFRDFNNKSYFDPLFNLWWDVMNLERGSKFPFYINPGVKEADTKGNNFLDFLDNLVDIHEIERNKNDTSRSFYQRLFYVARNLHIHQNDTLVNLMFDTKLSKPQYDRLNRTIGVRHTFYLLSMSAFHTIGFTYLCYFFRYRKLTLAP